LAYPHTWGFKPRLATYDGWETPVPLQINIQHEKADVAQVAGDILERTKLNYNAGRLGDAKPATVEFCSKLDGLETDAVQLDSTTAALP
jgi:hypothetical protein